MCGYKISFLNGGAFSTLTPVQRLQVSPLLLEHTKIESFPFACSIATTFTLPLRSFRPMPFGFTMISSLKFIKFDLEVGSLHL